MDGGQQPEALFEQAFEAARQQVVAALREREARTRAILENTVEAIITIDEQGLIESFNPAAERMFAYPAAEVIGHNVRMLMPSPYREEHDGYLEHYRRTGEKRIIGIGREVVGQCKDGATFPMELTISEVRFGDQRLFTGIVRDITERRRIETELRQARDELEQRVRERTAALEAANEDVRRFAYIVSHDLRAPLVNIEGFAGELRSIFDLMKTALPILLPHLDEPQRTEVACALSDVGPEALDFIETSVTRMNALIRAILALSRAGHRDLHIEPLDTGALVRDIVQTFTHQLSQHPAQVKVASLPTVYADRSALEQILGNLLSNAVKFLEPGRPGEITVTAEQDLDFTTLHVRDNGRGIAADDLARVFELFRRVGRQDTGGEGMGLAYVQALVRRHGGDILCQSTPGVGTTFTFTLANRHREGLSHAT